MGDFRTFDGITLRYADEGDGPAVVLVHGLAIDTDMNFRETGVLGGLLGAGLRVIGLDQRGHGRSDKPHDPAAYADDAMVRDLVALFDHLGLGAGTHVVGYSMGSGVALRFALLDDRVGRLVLGGTDGGLGDDPAARTEGALAAAAALEAPSEDAVADPDLRQYRAFMASLGADLLALAALQRARRFPVASRDEVARLRPPTLVVCGQEDVSPEVLAAAVPDGRAVVVPGDHFTAVREPAFTAAIVGFLSGG